MQEFDNYLDSSYDSNKNNTTESSLDKISNQLNHESVDLMQKNVPLTGLPNIDHSCVNDEKLQSQPIQNIKSPHPNQNVKCDQSLQNQTQPIHNIKFTQPTQIQSNQMQLKQNQIQTNETPPLSQPHQTNPNIPSKPKSPIAKSNGKRRNK